MEYKFEEPLEGNLLLAQLEGGVRYHSLSFEKLEYHSNWEWLMPIVEMACREKYEDAQDHQDTAFPRTFGMPHPYKEEVLMVRFNRCAVFEAKTLIEATWLACIDFAEWKLNQTTEKSPD